MMMVEFLCEASIPATASKPRPDRERLGPSIAAHNVSSSPRGDGPPACFSDSRVYFLLLFQPRLQNANCAGVEINIIPDLILLHSTRDHPSHAPCTLLPARARGHAASLPQRRRNTWNISETAILQHQETFLKSYISILGFTAESGRGRRPQSRYFYYHMDI
jgi:hypothetical protein